MKEKLKIAIQKSGRLQSASLQLLRECGIVIDNGKDQLKAVASNFPIEVLFLRNSDIPAYINDGVASMGIIGENVLEEKGFPLIKELALGFSKCRLSIAIPKDQPYTQLKDLSGKKIATSYPRSLQNFLHQNNIKADIHFISGSVEIAPNIGLADAICDLVSSGSTLFKNNLKEVEKIAASQAWLVRSPKITAAQTQIFDQFKFRLESVLLAKNYKYLLMNVPNESIAAISKILPGMKAPTVMPLTTEGWSSMHTVIQKNGFWEIINELKSLGAEGILVNPIEKMIA